MRLRLLLPGSSASLHLFALLGLGGCCQAPPQWTELDPITVAVGVDVPVDLGVHATGDHLSFRAVADPGVELEVVGDMLHVTGVEGFDGYSTVTVTAEDQCGQTAESSLSVRVSDRARSDACVIRLTSSSTAGSVAVAGDFNDWSTTTDVMTRQDDGTFAIELQVPTGDYAYKLVEDGAWRCDPEEPAIVCDEGQTWLPDCPADGNACNSLLHVVDCDRTQLSVDRLSIDRSAAGVQVTASADRTPTAPWATLDGAPVEGWSGDTFSYSAAGLSRGRHTLRLGADGAEPLYIPFWLDDREWATGVMYFAFVDRFANGDPSIDGDEFADVDYAGGDWAGLRDRLDYLDELGVTVLWLTAPVDNAEGAFDGKCDSTYSAYHGYWPDGEGLEEHFGDDAELRALVDEAHARDMRVLVDWVGNHVHQDHDDYATRPEWFNDRYICDQDEDGDGVTNWDQRPETCWFTSYLPDYDYTQVDPLVESVDRAITLAKDYELDGFRIDAVKHMPHSVFVDTQARIAAEIEHTAAGGDEDFYTVGETFDGYDRIAAYLGDAELDAQFDFPLYWAVLGAFGRHEIGLSNGAGSLQAVSEASAAAYGGAVMSTFLGNHDVPRFLAHASGEVSSAYGDSPCGNDGLVSPDQPAGWAEPYERLRLAWAYLLTSPGLPLVYYGDEYGQPGYADPDNRQVMRFDDELSADEADTLEHVRRLGQARREHPAFALGTTVDWWENEADVWAYARAYGGDAVLVVLNRSDDERTLTNGLAFAGLPQGEWADVLTGATTTSTGDSLTVTVPPRSARVLVPR